jgi:hypothetical protein
MSNSDEIVMRTYSAASRKPKGTGPGSAGQSGDTQGLSDIEEAGSESVEELLEEGQAFEAEVILGVENAPNADEKKRVRTKQVPEDDVPAEYIDADNRDVDRHR